MIIPVRIPAGSRNHLGGFNEESLMMGLFNNLRRKKQVEEIVWGLIELRIKGPPVGWWS